MSTARRLYHKLSRRYFAPFKILDRIGQVAYKLDLTKTSKIHLVFHVSPLKPYKGQPPSSPGSRPPISTNDQPILIPRQS